MASKAQQQMIEPGQRAPEFSLRDMDGGSSTLADLLAGGRTLLAFFKVTCPVCQYTFPYLERLHKGAPDGAVRFVAVSQDDRRDTQEFLKQHGVSFPALLDEDARGYPASNGFQIAHVPSMFLVEPDGRISWASNGFSKAQLADLGQRLGATLFRPGEKVPEWQPG